MASINRVGLVMKVKNKILKKETKNMNINFHKKYVPEGWKHEGVLDEVKLKLSAWENFCQWITKDIAFLVEPRDHNYQHTWSRFIDYCDL